MSELSDAEIVIIGGGGVGCGVAYSLAQAGKTDILLIEKEPTLAAVTTSQAAGLVGQVRSTVDRVRLAMWSVETFSEMQKDERANPGWRQVGSLRVALTDARVEEFKQLKAVCDEAGLAVEFIEAQEARKKWPMMNFDAAKAILWCPTDGYIQPSDLAMAYSSHARRLGVRFATDTAVTDVFLNDGRVEGVETDKGTVRCKTVINAAGANAYRIAQAAGIELPIVPVRHEFFVTVHSDEFDPSFPVVRIPDIDVYMRAEVNSLLVGGWEPYSLSFDPATLKNEGPSPRIEDGWEVLAQFAEDLVPHLPRVAEMGVRSVFKGWPTFTPDGRFIIGESCRVGGFVMAGGCNAHGVSGSAGIGRHVVESMLEENPSDYVRSLSPDRFTEQPWDWKTVTEQARDIYSNYYSIGH